MEEHMKGIIRLLSVVMVVSLILAGCAREEKTDSDKTLAGWVYASEPVSSAELSIYNTKGERILEGEGMVADEQGIIMLATAKLPSDFKIIAQNGRLYGEAFDAVLRTDVRGFNAESDTIYINLATTFVGAYLDKKPEATLDEAVLSVKTFLELPEWFDLSSGTQLSGEYFNNAQFLTEANENGGVNPFIDMLLTEMEAGKTHPFKEESLQGAGSMIAKELAKGAASYLGGELMGWGLSKAGINFGDEDHTAEELAEIKNGMQEMQSQLNEMSIQLDAISTQLKNIQNQLKDMLKQITHQQALSEYAGRVAQMSNLISNVNTIQRDLNHFVANPPSNPEKTRQSLINRIENSIVDNADTIHNYLVGIAGEKPLITLWREIVYEDRFLDSYDYDRVKAQYDFFKQYQETILLLRVEYYHALEEKPGDNEKIIMDCIEHFNSQIEQQEKLLSPPIEKYMVIDTKWDIMFYSENIEFGKADSAFSATDKTREEVFNYMEELAKAKYAGYSDWKALENNYFGALYYYDFNPKVGSGQWNWSEFLISNGWPGKSVPVTFVPVKKAENYPQAIFMNDGSHPKHFSPYKEKGYNDDSIYYLIMAARWINENDHSKSAKMYGYEHLKS
jgi:hypothetical protein